MKKQYSVSIKKPCSENWNSFEPRLAGGFCDTCQKTVTDFTAMGDKEVSAFLAKSSGKDCGRFRSNQLSQVYTQPTDPSRNYTWQVLRASIASLSLMFVTNNGMSQGLVSKQYDQRIQRENQTKKEPETTLKSQKFSGIVTDEYGDALPGVNVILKGTINGTITDIDGAFTFPIELNKGDVLIFAFIGLETKEYIIDKGATADIAMSVDITMSLDLCVFMGALAVEEVYTSKPTGVRGFWIKVKSLF